MYHIYEPPISGFKSGEIIFKKKKENKNSLQKMHKITLIFCLSRWTWVENYASEEKLIWKKKKIM